MKLKLILLVLSLLLLSACSAGFGGFGQPTTNVLQDYYVGTEGVELQFVEGAPPRQLNELQNFDFQVLVHNRGAHDVTGERKIILDWMYDTAVVNRFDTSANTDYQQSRFIELHGRSLFYQNGEQDFYSLGRFQTSRIRNNFAGAFLPLHATLCYPYQTTFAQEVCVDTDITNTDVRIQACEITPELRFSGGQGAPIAVTRLTTEYEASGPFARPVFSFTLENLGDGIFYYDAQPVCSQPTFANMYVVGFEARLGNETLNCPPEVFLDNGVGSVDCFMDGDGFLLSRANFVTAITANISYHYQETYTLGSGIERQSQYFMNLTSPASCAPWEIYDTSTQNCISRCDYCVQNPGANDCTSSDTLISNNQSFKKPLPGAACIFTEEECVRAGDNCIREEGSFCIPGLYCGVPECVYNSRRNDGVRVSIEPSADPLLFTWYCTDDETTVSLQSSCGCASTSSYAFTATGVDCPDNPSSYTEISGRTNFGLQRVYYSVERASIADDIDTLCVKVRDATGDERLERYRFR